MRASRPETRKVPLSALLFGPAVSTMKPVMAPSAFGFLGTRLGRSSWPSNMPAIVISPRAPLASPWVSPRGSVIDMAIVPFPTAVLPGSIVHVFSLAFFGGSTGPTFATYEPDQALVAAGPEATEADGAGAVTAAEEVATEAEGVGRDDSLEDDFEQPVTSGAT